VTLRLPAYAREIADARKAGMVPASGEVIVALDLWRLGKQPGGSLARCLVPEDRKIEELDFWFLAGLDVLVAWSSAVTAGSRVMALAKALLAIDPRRLLLIDVVAEPGRACQWIKSVERGIEVQP
jgi:hypothetical protein